MVATIEENEPGKQPARLKTEGPLFEKDQQGLATEQQRKLGEIALAKWRRLREKIAHPLNK